MTETEKRIADIKSRFKRDEENNEWSELHHDEFEFLLDQLDKYRSAFINIESKLYDFKSKAGFMVTDLISDIQEEQENILNPKVRDE